MPPLRITPEFESYIKDCRSAEVLKAYSALQELLEEVKPRQLRRFTRKHLPKLNLENPSSLLPLTETTLREQVLPQLELLLEELWEQFCTRSPPFSRRRS
jgi:hypothetical protein